MTQIQQGPATVAAAAPSETRGMTWAWYSVGVLLLVQWMNGVDRSIINVVLHPVKLEFGLSDTQLGALSALCYAISYSFAALPLGMLVDRVNRAKLLAAVLTAWSAVTIFTGMAQNYLQLVLARMGLAIFEAGSQPTGLAMITDIFPPRKRAMAISVFMLSVPLSGLIGTTLSGHIAANYGWRSAFFILGIPGFFLAILVLLTLRDPRAAQLKQGLASVRADAPPRQNWRQSLKAIVPIFRASPALGFVLLGTILMAAVASGFMIWMPSFLIRAHGLDIATAATVTGMTAGLSGLIGIPLGGMLADRLGKKDMRRVAYIAGAVGLACAPLMALSLMTENATMAIVLIGVWSLIHALGQAPAYSLYASLAPQHMRGTVVSMLSIATNGLAYGLGPQIIGILSDLLEPSTGNQSLRYALMSVFLFKALSGVFYFMSARTLRADLERAQAGPA